MEFKKGDVIYCVDNMGTNFLETNIKYEVLGIDQDHLKITDELSIGCWYIKKRFISELEHRRLKLIKIKNEIQSRRHSLLYR